MDEVKLEINSSVQNWIEELEEEFQLCVNPMEVYYNQAKKLIYTFGGKQALGKFLTEKVSLLRTVRVSQDIEKFNIKFGTISQLKCSLSQRC